MKMGFLGGHCSLGPPREGIFEKVQLASEIQAAACRSASRRHANFEPKNDQVHTNSSSSFHSRPILQIESCGESILKGHDFKPKKLNFDQEWGAWLCSEVPRNGKKLDFSAVSSQ